MRERGYTIGNIDCTIIAQVGGRWPAFLCSLILTRCCRSHPAAARTLLPLSGRLCSSAQPGKLGSCVSLIAATCNFYLLQFLPTAADPPAAARCHPFMLLLPCVCQPRRLPSHCYPAAAQDVAAQGGDSGQPVPDAGRAPQVRCAAGRLPQQQHRWRRAVRSVALVRTAGSARVDGTHCCTHACSVLTSIEHALLFLHSGVPSHSYSRPRAAAW